MIEVSSPSESASRRLPEKLGMSPAAGGSNAFDGSESTLSERRAPARSPWHQEQLTGPALPSSETGGQGSPAELEASKADSESDAFEHEAYDEESLESLEESLEALPP